MKVTDPQMSPSGNIHVMGEAADFEDAYLIVGKNIKRC